MMSSSVPSCNLINLGMMDYREAWLLQQNIAEARAANQIPDTLLLLEHPHTYTLGRSGKREHLLMTLDQCEELGITILDVNRGGDITYHGPGQLVTYPICFLGRPDASGRIVHTDFVGYIRRLENVLIETLSSFGIEGQREQGLTGVWVNTGKDLEKIAAIGIHVDAYGVSTHGIALNVTTDLRYFGGIIPCGIRDKRVCSMESLLRSEVPGIAEVRDQFAASYARTFNVALKPIPIDDLLATTQPSLPDKERQGRISDEWPGKIFPPVTNA